MNAHYKPIVELEISVRSYMRLRDAQIKTLGELAAWTEADLTRKRILGRKSLQELTEVLAEFGLKFATHTDDEDDGGIGVRVLRYPHGGMFPRSGAVALSLKDE